MVNSGNTPTAQPSTSKVDRYTAVGRKHLTIGVADNGQPFAYKADADNWIAHSLRGKWIKNWLRMEASKNNDTLRNDDIKDIVENLYAHAAADVKRIQTHLRVGKNHQGDVEIDLGTKDLARVQLSAGKTAMLQH